MPIKRVKNPIDPPKRKAIRLKPAHFKKVDLKRAIDGARRVGFEIGAVDIRPDGTITIRAATDRGNGTAGIFEQWEDRL